MNGEYIMSRNKNLFKLFLTLGALTTTCFFLNASATEAGTAVEVAGMDVDFSKLDVQSLKDANLNNNLNDNKSFDKAAYEEALKTDDYKKFCSYNVPIKVNEDVKALANKVVLAYIGKYIINAIGKNPYINEFLKIKERYSATMPDELLSSVGEGLETEMGGNGRFRYYHYDSTNKDDSGYLKCFAQPKYFSIFTNKVVADSMAYILNFFKENPNQFKNLLQSITTKELKEYAKSTINRAVERIKAYDEYEQKRTIDDFIKDIKIEQENSLKYAKKALKELSSGGDAEYVKTLEKRLKSCSKPDDKDWRNIHLQMLNGIKRELSKPDDKNAEENKKTMEKIDKEISVVTKELKDEKTEERRNEYINKLENALKDKEARKKMYDEELKSDEEWVKSCEDLLENEGKMREMATKRFEQNRKYLKDNKDEANVIAEQTADIDELSDEDLIAALNGLEITDGKLVKTYPDMEGWVPNFLEQEEQE